MKLISETIEHPLEILTEENKETGKKSFFIKGVFMQAETRNKNNRTYPKSILEREVGRYVKEFINKNRAYGELGHPAGPQINLERVSHMIKELYPDGNNYIGKAKIMETPYGSIVRNLIAEGAGLGVSSRGMGSLKRVNGNLDEVQDDYYLATPADIVADPSAPDAFVQGIMEGVEWLYDKAHNKWISYTAEKFQTAMRRKSVRQLEEEKLTLFNSFLSEISTTKS